MTKYRMWQLYKQFIEEMRQFLIDKDSHNLTNVHHHSSPDSMSLVHDNLSVIGL